MRRIADRGRGLGEVGDGAEPDAVERDALEARGREVVDDRPGLVVAAGLGEQVREHAAPAGDRSEPLAVRPHRPLEPLEGAALAPHRARLQQRGVAGVGVLDAVAERHGRPALRLGLLEIAGQ
jgi:hypothetical protein